VSVDCWLEDWKGTAIISKKIVFIFFMQLKGALATRAASHAEFVLRNEGM
jgi:hypothetical protein